jgi:hypothetical protein
MRLKVFSGDIDKWRDVARRLQRVELVHVGDSTRPSPLPQADLALFDGAAEARSDVIENAISAGMHALVFAAPCLPVGVPRRLLKQAQESKRRFACLNPDRLLPSRATIKTRLGASLGSPELVRIHIRQAHDAADLTAPLGLPSELVGAMEQAIWLIGRPLVRVFATEPRIEGDDAAGRPIVAHLQFDAGMATIDYDDRLPAGDHAAAASYRFLSVIGSSGSAQCDDQRNSQLLYLGGAPRAIIVDEGVGHLATEIDAFSKFCENDLIYPDGVALWGVMPRVVDAVLKSLQSRDVVVPEGL